ncbi:hypothetical protein [Mycoplasmopsis gallopavonis]|uniref:Hypothetical domain protein n=1 Tax=Mycoplasmopsis gallopavonis TaxID=76629 RepID=A0A449AZK0_9BACT|nr:hypothetical protein [Mycoplasmopsis gallopavonis]RIV16783.1 hypothetical protein D1113_00885 [Mycoplasmopsis gallopavonis]VEU72905.1 hypothetical domain protein [Mycoplasmopsis gallopavonis]
MKQYKVKKIPLKTKLQWAFFGKWPLERKTKPKILEYMFLVFNNIIAFLVQALLIYLLKITWNQESNQVFWNQIILLLQQNIAIKILICLVFVTYFANLILVIHVYYILNKTEFNKWISILGTLFALFYVFTPITIIVFCVAYAKNELAFE